MFVYSLSDPRDGVPRYVGKTERSPQLRLNHHLHLLSTEQVEEVSARYLAGANCCDLGELFGVSATTIANCLKRSGIPRRSPVVGRWLSEKRRNAEGVANVL